MKQVKVLLAGIGGYGSVYVDMFVKGLEGAEEYWREHQDFEMIAITEEGDIYVTEGLEDRFTLGSSFENMELHIVEA